MQNTKKKLLDHARSFATDAIKTALKKAIQKTEEATGESIGDKTAGKITKTTKTLPKNILEIVESEREIPRERCISK